MDRMSSKVMEDNRRLKMGTTYGAQPTYEAVDQPQRARKSPRRERKRSQVQSQVQSQQVQYGQQQLQGVQGRPRQMSNGYGVQQGATLAAAANMMQRPRTAPQQRVQPRYAPNVMAQVSQVSVPNMGM